MSLFESSLDPQSYAPLAERMRPREPAHFIGQEHLFGPGKALREIMERGVLTSFVLWGPPGTGKTTIARLVARRARAEFIELSAVSDGIPRIREVVKAAKENLSLHRRRTVVFVDEIHRWNTTAQDAMLPHVENGTVVLLGATTENVSFELRPALLSRVRVYVLHSLNPEAVRSILEGALADPERGLGAQQLTVEPAALDLLVLSGDGDVRRALGSLELAAAFAGPGGTLTEEMAREAVGRMVAKHDAESHYNLASALQKSLRGSDVDASVYYLARLLAGGDPRMAIRRLLVIAAEDIGMADPQALLIARAAAEAYERTGSPEGDIILAQATVYLATAPKSNRAYLALARAREAIERSASVPVPLHLRQAPTKLMQALGYKEGYEYPFDRPTHFSTQPYLPESLRGEVFYQPSAFGFEKKVAERLEWWRGLREKG